MEKHDQYYETDGPVLSSASLTPESLTDEYSFIMKDEVIQSCIAFIKENHVL
jgi:8-oxo-dGTP diphosphatase